MNKRAARQLTADIRASYKDLEAKLTEAITLDVWSPLGYASFTEWFDSELEGVPLATRTRAMVVVAMFAEKTETLLTDKQIAQLVGTSAATITRIKASWNAGLLNFLPSGRKRPERREWTDKWRWIQVRAPIALHHELQDWGRQHGKTLQEIQSEALELYADSHVRTYAP